MFLLHISQDRMALTALCPYFFFSTSELDSSGLFKIMKQYDIQKCKSTKFWKYSHEIFEMATLIIDDVIAVLKDCQSIITNPSSQLSEQSSWYPLSWGCGSTGRNAAFFVVVVFCLFICLFVCFCFFFPLGLFFSSLGSDPYGLWFCWLRFCC